MARGFDNVSGFDNKDSLKESDLFDIYALAKEANGQWVNLRFLPIDYLPIKKHWIRIMGGKDKDKLIKIPRMCTHFDPDNESRPLKGRDCPYCKIEHGNDESGAPAQIDLKYWFQAIIRDEEDSKPRKLPKPTKTEKATGKKDKASDSWTPVRMVALTPALARKIKELGERNFDKKKNTHPVSHAKYGIDVAIKYNSKAAPADRYSLDKGDRTPLTEEELKYLTWDVENYAEIYDLMGRLDTEGSLADYKKLDIIGATSVDEDDEDEDDDDDVPLKKSKKGKKDKSSKKKRSLLDDDDDDDDDDDVPLKKKAKKLVKKKKKKKSDEDDKPSKKKKKKSDDKPVKKKKKSDDKPVKKKKRTKDDDDDKPSKKKKKKK